MAIYVDLKQDCYTLGKELTIKDILWLFNLQSNEYKGFRRQVNFSNFYTRNILKRVNGSMGQWVNGLMG